MACISGIVPENTARLAGLSMDDNCGEWVESMVVVIRRWVWLVDGIYGCG